MNKTLAFAFLLLTAMWTVASAAAEKVPYPGGKFYIYRLTLRDKKGSLGSLDRPKAFLSDRAIKRRARQQLPLDSTDLPVSASYISGLKRQGAHIIGMSKWNNTVLVRSTDTTLMAGLARLPYVQGIRRVFQSPDSMTILTPEEISCTAYDVKNSADCYGQAASQIDMLSGRKLHEAGYRGRGMLIAVIDGGYMNANALASHYHFNIVGQRDCVWPYNANIYHLLNHGTMVLSTMGAHADSAFVGTAPEASYLLLRSEDSRSEQEVEEDYWAQAAEYADSVGADLINTSLGYTRFDNKALSHQYADQDGQTALISRTASLLAGKGIILVCSAGNEGAGTWKRIGFPADARHCLTVAALSSDSVNAPFSSVGPAYDGRVKPDVGALGLGAAVVGGNGKITSANGTSFASPILCGMVACLWQALPQMSATDIIKLVRRSADRSAHPDNVYGYGIPNFYKAWLYGKQ